MRFILVDRILEMKPGQTILAEKHVGANEPYFADHFPGFPVVPGVLLVEMMAQTAGKCLDLPQPQSALDVVAKPKAMLAQILSARFLRWVRPDTHILIHAQIKTSQPAVATASCHVEVKGGVVARAELLFSFVPRDQFAADYRDTVLEDYLRRRGQDGA